MSSRRPPAAGGDFLYDLPPELIAQSPAPDRGASRLMVVRRDRPGAEISVFDRLESFLPEGALLVANDAKVTPARLLGRLAGGGGRAELLILDPPVAAGPGPADAWCLGRPGRRLVPGASLVFGEGRSDGEGFEDGEGPTVGEGRTDGEILEAEVLAAEPGGPRRLVRLHFRDAPAAVLGRLGRPPLPPYIRRPAGPEDRERYQTVYAASPGAVAAPTAGLHFTAGHLARLAASGRRMAFVNLRVGAGTFAPLTESQLREGLLHEEDALVGPEAVADIEAAKREGRLVVAVGTTTARALEWAAQGGALRPRRGGCRLFIRPGHEFRVVEALITNFHLPGSSLMHLVGALLGRERLLEAYALAVGERMRFYSYGDAMLVL